MSHVLTPDNVSTILDDESKVTPQPWAIGYEPGNKSKPELIGRLTPDGGINVIGEIVNIPYADAKFIASSRSYVPDLIATIHLLAHELSNIEPYDPYSDRIHDIARQWIEWARKEATQ